MDADKPEYINNISWNIIHRYFKDNPYNLVSHHIDTYNDFFSRGIYQIFLENNPIRIIEKIKDKDDSSNKNLSECVLYMGGKTANKIYFGKPIIYDDANSSGLNETNIHYMYPNDARLRNMTYGFTIHYDVDIDVNYTDDSGIFTSKSITLNKIYLGTFPIMLHSNLCILKGLSTEVRFNLGECRNDYGGYFIINGKEKVILSQEKFGDNMLYVRKNKEDDVYSYSCEVHSVSEDSSKPIRFTSVKMIGPGARYTNNQIVVDIPNVKKPIPLFIVMRALGIISDKSIIETCLLDLEKNEDMIDLFIPSIHDTNKIFNQPLALEFMSKFTKAQTISSVQNILMNYFLPHIGEDNFINKAYYIGFMVYKLLRVFTEQEPPTDRDNFIFKRIETSGSLIYDLFREYYLLQKQQIKLLIDKLWYYGPGYSTNLLALVTDNEKDIFRERIVEKGFKIGFKGNWGASEHTKRVGLVQDLNRLSWFTFISHLRKINLPLDPTAKVVAPHLLHTSQWGIIDPIDTPDGGNIGLHKHMAITSSITNSYLSYDIIRWIRYNLNLLLLTECTAKTLSDYTKVFVNGNWIGVLEDPINSIIKMKIYRRNGLIPIYTSISFNYKTNTIYIYTDGGRLTRPIFYRKISYNYDANETNYENWSYENIDDKIINGIVKGNVNWSSLVSGFQPKFDENFNLRNNIVYFNENNLYSDANIETLDSNCSLLEYIDVSEEESSLISMSIENVDKNKYYTHCEIDPSTILGIMGNSVIYPEHNPCARNLFSCGQSRQAVSVYHTNHQMRLDKMGVVLNYGQTPIVKSRYLEYINNEEMSYGVNAIVAIMCYTGYNVEDAILINEGSIKRGLFRTTYYTSYVGYEESSKVKGSSVESYFTNIENKLGVQKIKDGYDYSRLDENGLIKENTLIDDKIILIGQVTQTSENKGLLTDNSVTTKKGQLGFVDKAFLTEGEEGFRIAKIRIREERLPAIGDKMASRSGQKGTVGLVIPEEDMPFTADGIRPDLIINPHAIPSRMTIGQLVESVLGKLCVINGSFGDCTAFSAKGSNYDVYGNLLVQNGYHKSGNEILYSGYTGEQLYSDIYIGPTYYMRLKHMVKDKINYRATGKRSALTRQTNQGRANDGGLRIGEMERDSIMGHGMSYFLNESFMVRGDQYHMAVCNKTGTIAIYNEEKKLFLSPFADGPLNFNITSKTTSVINSISKFGRSFSIIRIPYSLKLLIQELQVMNVQMRIITEDNVDQLLNLSYQSQNINKLLNIEENLKGDEMINMVKDYVKSSIGKNLDTFYKSYAKSSKSAMKKITSTNQLKGENVIINLSEKDARYIFPEKENVNYNKLYTTTIGQYSTSNLFGSNQLVNIIQDNIEKDPSELVITDGTANVGSDTINLAMNFKNVNSYEIDKITYDALKNNVEEFKLNNVRLYNGDITKMIDYGQDVIYIDAPWGGKEYKKSNNISLYLSGMEISEFYSKYLDRASLFIFKVPLNYKISNFENAGISLMNVKKEEFILGDKPMYLFLIINGNPLMRTENKQTEDESYLFGGTKTNGINFLNSSLEQLFNSLSSDNQIKIKSLNDDNEINKVLTMIHNKITQGNEFKGGTELETNFNILPEHIKYGALGKAYEQMAGEFKETSEELEGESIKTKLPEKDNIPEEFKIKEITDSSSININNDESKNENQSETKNVSFG
jgi:DNA-directed RNA polymerase II subunit RPB2